jgi:hypothetical protein
MFTCYARCSTNETIVFTMHCTENSFLSIICDLNPKFIGPSFVFGNHSFMTNYSTRDKEIAKPNSINVVFKQQLYVFFTTQCISRAVFNLTCQRNTSA